MREETGNFTVCRCSNFKRLQAGATRVDDVLLCRRCGQPLSPEDAEQRAGADAAGPLSATPLANAAGVTPAMMTTLPSLPGWQIVESHGVVTELAATWGTTAEAKGNSALDDALRTLAGAANQLGANAIVGLAGSTFGARGGITSGFGGDAVGVLLMGTAVTVEPVEAPPDPKRT